MARDGMKEPKRPGYSSVWLFGLICALLVVGGVVWTFVHQAQPQGTKLTLSPLATQPRGPSTEEPTGEFGAAGQRGLTESLAQVRAIQASPSSYVGHSVELNGRIKEWLTPWAFILTTGPANQPGANDLGEILVSEADVANPALYAEAPVNTPVVVTGVVRLFATESRLQAPKTAQRFVPYENKAILVAQTIATPEEKVP